MPTTYTKQLQATLTQDANGYVITETYKVDGLTGDGREFTYQALNADDIPRRGAAHPALPQIQADSFTVEMIDSDKAQITVTFRQLSGLKININDAAPAQIEVGATVTELPTQKDIYGEQLKTKHTYLDRDEAGTYLFYTVDSENRKIPRTLEQVGTVQIQVPSPFMKFSRRESRDPRLKSMNYVGRLNTGRWLDGDEGTWMCKSITGTSDDGGRSYNVNYEFQYNPDGWQPYITSTYPDTKEPVANPVEGVGIKRAYVYDYAVFDELNLGYKG